MLRSQTSQLVECRITEEDEVINQRAFPRPASPDGHASAPIEEQVHLCCLRVWNLIARLSVSFAQAAFLSDTLRQLSVFTRSAEGHHVVVVVLNFAMRSTPRLLPRTHAQGSAREHPTVLSATSHLKHRTWP